LGKAETESDMSNQEMQFADPDWKPSQKLDAKTGTQEQETFIPEPINADSRERWNTTPPPPPRQEMYTGLPPYAGATPQQPVRGQYRQGPYRRGGRGIWFWVILAFIIISLMGGGFGSAFNRFGDDGRFSSPGFNGPQSSIVESPRTFSVKGTPTVVISGDNGTINVQTSSDAHTVTIQDTKDPGFLGNPNATQINYNQSPDGNTINASVQDNGQGSVDFTVTVPQGADLQLSTNSGTISFNGTIGPSGTDQFTTSSGAIDLTVSPDSAFHLNASTNSGSVNTGDFPKVTVNQAGTQATGNVGTASKGQGATVTLNTDSGNIDVHLGP
jgi:Putative adhesin